MIADEPRDTTPAPASFVGTPPSVDPQERTLVSYLKPLGKHTLLIGILVLLAFVGGLFAWALTASTAPYEAEALVLFKPGANSLVDLSVDPQFLNPDVELPRQQRSVVLLMGSMDVAKEVQRRAASSNSSEAATIASMSALDINDSVDVQLRGDFISVRGSASTPAAATWLANTWAEVGVDVANKTYAQPSANVDQALDEANAQLESDQKALEDFLADNSTNILSQELIRVANLITAAVQSSVNVGIVLHDAEQASILAQITGNYTATATLDQHLYELEALRTRIEQSPEDQGSLYANQVTLLLLLNKIIVGTSATEAQLQLSLSDLGTGPLSKSSQLSDLDATISAVRRMQEEIRTQNEELKNSLNTPRPYPTGEAASASPTLQELTRQQSALQSQFEQRLFEQTRLQATRDLSQSAYDLLRSRLAEQKVNVLISNIVDIGSAADEGQTAQSRSMLTSLVFATGGWVLIALVLGIVLAYLLSLARPNFNSNEALGRRIFRGGPKRVRVSRSG